MLYVVIDDAIFLGLILSYIVVKTVSLPTQQKALPCNALLC